MKKKKQLKCDQCRAVVKFLHAWRNNFVFAEGETKWLCDRCFEEKTISNAGHLLKRCIRARKGGRDDKSFDLFLGTYDKSTNDEKLIFSSLLGQGHAD